MSRSFPALLAITALVACVGCLGCSSQQLYGTGQAMQRNECNKLADLAERQRCMEAVNRSHDSYEREAAAARQPAR